MISRELLIILAKNFEMCVTNMALPAVSSVFNIVNPCLLFLLIVINDHEP